MTRRRVIIKQSPPFQVSSKIYTGTLLPDAMRRAAAAACGGAHRAALRADGFCVRSALAELRAAAQHSTAARASVGAVVRATPVALCELARTAALQARCSAAPLPPPRGAAAAAALAAPRRPLVAALQAAGEAVLTLARAVQLCLLFSPLLASAPLCLLYGLGREQWLHLLNQTLRVAGPAFIKWGQARGARSRAGRVTSLRRLTPPPGAVGRHARRPLPARHVRRADQPPERRARAQLGAHATNRGVFIWATARGAAAAARRRRRSRARSQSMFVTFEQTPVASGSIAQVHRATLAAPPGSGARRRAGALRRGQGGGDTVVAVKVRHPGVATIINRDFAILRMLAELAGTVPGLAWMRLDESVRQFREPLFEQVDLTREAANLRAFNENFRAWRRVSFPVPVEHLVTPAVLVESFEQGASIRDYLTADDAELRRSLADLGVKMLLKMMLADNFVHADVRALQPLPSARARAFVPDHRPLTRARSCTRGTFLCAWRQSRAVCFAACCSHGRCRTSCCWTVA